MFLHPTGNNANTPLIADYKLTWMIGAPAEEVIAVLQLIAAGVPKRFPNMKIIHSHLGGAVAMVLKRWDSVSTWEYPQMPERPSIAARRMWYDTVDYGDVPALRATVDSLGIGQVVLGSDFPYETGVKMPIAWPSATYVIPVLKRKRLNASCPETPQAYCGCKHSRRGVQF